MAAHPGKEISTNIKMLPGTTWSQCRFSSSQRRSLQTYAPVCLYYDLQTWIYRLSHCCQTLTRIDISFYILHICFPALLSICPQGIQILWRLLGNCFYRCMRWYLEVLPHIKTKRGCRMWIKWDKNSVGDAWMVFPGLTPALLFKALIIYIWHLVNATTRFLRIMIPFFFRTSGRR